MKARTKHPLYFTRSERHGIACFAVLCTLIFWAPSRFSQWEPKARTDFAPFQQQIAGFHTSAAGEPLVSDAPVDPNTAAETELIAAGFPARTARMLVNYREKGGQFRYREDLKKLYAMDEELYQRLAPRIDLPARTDTPPAAGIRVKNVSGDRLEPFDPNTAAQDQLLRMGLPDRIVNTIANYRAKGGTFRFKQDLRKIYGLTEEWYERLAPYVQLANSPGKTDFAKDRPAAPPVVLDINRADAEEWRSLPGVGPVLSARIVKFRDKLGGFHSVEQVAETYGLPDSTFQRIAGRLTASPILHPILINSASIEDLQAHPYLDWRQAKAIVQYRVNHGPLQNLEDFARIQVLDETQRARIAPYLVFE